MKQTESLPPHILKLAGQMQAFVGSGKSLTETIRLIESEHEGKIPIMHLIRALTLAFNIPLSEALRIQDWLDRLDPGFIGMDDGELEKRFKLYISRFRDSNR